MRRIPPRSPEQNEEIRQERVEQILDAALTLYCQKGYAASEVADVADLAGVARGLVYYYFQSKRGLFQALFDWVQQRGERMARGVLFDHPEWTPRECLTQMARRMCESTLDDSRYSRFYMRMFQDMEHVYGDQTDAQTEKRYRIMRWIAQVVADGMARGEFSVGSPIISANAYWGALTMNLGELVRQSLPPDESREQVEQIVRACLTGIVAKEGNRA